MPGLLGRILAAVTPRILAAVTPRILAAVTPRILAAVTPRIPRTLITLLELETTPMTVDSPLSRAQTRIRVSSQEQDGLFLVLIPGGKKQRLDRTVQFSV
ncbi:hypothetical protein JOQ06_009668 [Pogonophryne albipinna]|uniref:Uncharacterized protein n=1 Tax=Pogonophryne albipinna TaxID=1090488 RepID=A0AAD6BRK4_9TELE|nr:hypothetical protein JOQ06_009668 [Pogonophryne albipinna]